jgi:hypothetical protein
MNFVLVIRKLGLQNSVKKRDFSSAKVQLAHLSFCFEDTLYRTFLPNFCSFGYSVSEDKIF